MNFSDYLTSRLRGSQISSKVEINLLLSNTTTMVTVVLGRQGQNENVEVFVHFRNTAEKNIRNEWLIDEIGLRTRVYTYSERHFSGYKSAFERCNSGTASLWKFLKLNFMPQF